MKSASLLLLVSLLLVSPRLAQPVQKVVPPNQAADGVYRVAEMGPNHQTWQRITQELDENGFLGEPLTNSYVELASGLNYFSEADQRWTAASDEIEILAEGAVARKSQHFVSFSSNLNDPNGTTDLLLHNGKRITSRCIGLAYTDDTGRSVFIAEVKDTQGFVLGRNQVVYMDAFDSIRANIRFTTTRSSFESDVILLEQLPDPRDLGMRPEAVRLEVWTAILNDVQPDVTPVQRKRKDGQEEADVDLDFGAMRIGPGKAFTLAAQEQEDPLELERNAINVSKEWTVVQGNRFLIESLPYLEAKPLTDALPPPQARVRINAQERQRLLSRATGQSRVLPMTLAQRTTAPSKAKEFQMAKLDRAPQQPGVVVDWQSVSTASNFIFQSDLTYFITSVVYLSGVTTFEGGAIVKFDRYTTSNYIQLIVYNSIKCATSAYRPIIFTAKDDDTVGDIINGSTGSPTGPQYGYIALRMVGNSPAVQLENVRVSYCVVGPYFQTTSGQSIRNSQVVGCSYGLLADTCSITAENVLLNNGITALWTYASGSSISGVNLTINGFTYVAGNDVASTFNLMNSLIVAVTSVGSPVPFNGSYNAIISSASSVFQVPAVGGGNHYLAANTFRNAGTTAISAQLLEDLKKKTTYPPLLLTSPITANTTLSPQVQRDTDTPDLGYHYSPLDYLLSEVTVSTATLLLNNGVAVGCYGYNGLKLQNGAVLNSEGTPSDPNRLVRYRTVQENAISASEPYSNLIICDGTYSPTPQVSLLSLGWRSKGKVSMTQRSGILACLRRCWRA